MFISRNPTRTSLLLPFCFALLFSVLSCGGGEDASTLKKSVTPQKRPAAKTSSDPLAAEKALISGMDADQALNYMNDLSETDCSLEERDNGLWIVAENGNEANMTITSVNIIHRNFILDDVQKHKYGFGVGGYEGPVFFVTEEENHDLMLYALQHLKKLAARAHVEQE
jgi:hypothetical protein